MKIKSSLVVFQKDKTVDVILNYHWNMMTDMFTIHIRFTQIKIDTSAIFS